MKPRAEFRDLGLAGWESRSLAARRPRAAFTLIELLVVIAIIALLVGILMPSLSKARILARRSATLGNLHSIGMQMGLYENEFDGEHPSNLVDVNQDGRAFMGFGILSKKYNLSPNIFINPNTKDTPATQYDSDGLPVLVELGGAEVTLTNPATVDGSNIGQVNWHLSFAYDHERKRNGNADQTRVYVGDRADYQGQRSFSANWGGEGMCLLWTDQHAAFSTFKWMQDQGDPDIYHHNEWAADGSGEGQHRDDGNGSGITVGPNVTDTHLRVFSEGEDDNLLPNQ